MLTNQRPVYSPGGLRPRGLCGPQQLHDREVQAGEILLRAEGQRRGPGEEASEGRVSRPVHTQPLVNLRRIIIASLSQQDEVLIGCLSVRLSVHAAQTCPEQSIFIFQGLSALREQSERSVSTQRAFSASKSE